MARLPNIRRIRKEDFPDQEWIDKLLWPLNGFMESVVSALNHGVSFKDNAAAACHEFEFKEDSSVYPLKFAWTLPGLRPTDLWVTRVVGAEPTGAVFAHWEYDEGSVSVKKFFGLTVGEKYKIRVIAASN